MFIKNNSRECVIIFFVVSMFGCSASQTKTTKQNIPSYISKLGNLTVYSSLGIVDTVQLIKIRNFEKHYSLPFGTAPITVGELNRVFLLNKQKLAIDVYDSVGKFITRIGRKGRGPGEFHEIKWMQILGDYLYIYDGILKQFQIYSLNTLSYVSTVQTIPKNLNIFSKLHYTYRNPIYVISDSTFLYQFTDRSKLYNNVNSNKSTIEANYSLNYFRMNHHGFLIPDTVLHQKGLRWISTHINGMGVFIYYPFARKALMAISENRHLFAARTQDFLIKVYNLKGEYLRAFYYPYQRVSLTPNQIDSITRGEDFIKKAMQEAIDKVNVPDDWPALHSMRLDDTNRLWVSTIVENQGVYQWWVLNKKGKLLARFRWPRTKPIVAIRNGYLYADKINHKMDTYEVVKYKIEFKKQ